MKHVYRVVANVLLDVERIVKEVSNRYEIPISEITMDDIYNYIDDNITFLKGKAPGIYEVEDGSSLYGFDERDYDDIEKVMLEMQREEGAA